MRARLFLDSAYKSRIRPRTRSLVHGHARGHVIQLGKYMENFNHEKLDVYNASIEFVELSNFIIKRLPKGKAYLADQLQRAASSISLNIAEGAGEFSKNEKARFYRMAKRSSTECAAILDICTKLQLIDQSSQLKSRGLLIRIVAMLTKLVKATASS